MQNKKVAIVHHWWLSNRGGEAVCAAIAEIFPDADFFFHVCDENVVRKALPQNFSGSINTTFISRLPGARRHYQKYLPLMPLALEQLDLGDYDLVISIESGPAKGVITRPDATHVCYCNSPMRYIWDLYHQYLSSAGRLTRILFPFIAHKLRMWDRLSADRVDYFIANSKFVRSRINKYYRRDAEVIFPPVDSQAFCADGARDDFYLYLGQLVAYKRPDLAVEAFNQMGLPLVVIGEGELFDKLQAMANPNITMMGRQPFSVVRDFLQRCRGVIHPGLEDFGIVPVEAMAAGAPVIAYGKGGALETVIHNKTGILFNEQKIQAIIEAVQKIEQGKVSFDPSVLHQHATGFDKAVFKQNFLSAINKSLGTSLS
ncbi:MAG: glycosyltransferase family 4 protein [Gammaproteobacteria bacterium]|nr:MAG: glycosyltransferase family 4 protein [Gammaproteobacteria bacterium]